MYIKSVNYLNQNRKNNRKIKVKLNTGSVITIESCHESWQQYGASRDELCFTVNFAELHNEWLHGGALPCI